MMLYKTIALGLIQERPQLCARLRKEKLMLLAVESFSASLKSSYQHWKSILSEQMRGESEELINSRATELAIEDLCKTLPDESRPNDQSTLMEAVLNNVRNHPAGS